MDKEQKDAKDLQLQKIGLDLLEVDVTSQKQIGHIAIVFDEILDDEDTGLFRNAKLEILVEFAISLNIFSANIQDKFASALAVPKVYFELYGSITKIQDKIRIYCMTRIQQHHGGKKGVKIKYGIS